jgi:hypothetical protein
MPRNVFPRSRQLISFQELEMISRSVIEKTGSEFRDLNVLDAYVQDLAEFYSTKAGLIQVITDTLVQDYLDSVAVPVSEKQKRFISKKVNRLEKLQEFHEEPEPEFTQEPEPDQDPPLTRSQMIRQSVFS